MPNFGLHQVHFYEEILSWHRNPSSLSLATDGEHPNVSNTLKKIHKRRYAKIKADLKKFGLRKTNSKYSYRNLPCFFALSKSLPAVVLLKLKYCRPYFLRCLFSNSSVSCAIFLDSTANSMVCFSSLYRYAAAFLSEKLRYSILTTWL